MKYKVEKVNREKAKSLLPLQMFALVYRYDGIEIIDKPDIFIDAFDAPDCYEARFFSKTSEIHMIEESGSREFFYLSDINKEDAEIGEKIVSAESVERKYKVAKRFSPWRTVRIKEYLVPDQEDGQMCIAATRVVGLEK